jgi:hypothetical protein
MPLFAKTRIALWNLRKSTPTTSVLGQKQTFARRLNDVCYRMNTGHQSNNPAIKKKPRSRLENDAPQGF